MKFIIIAGLLILFTVSGAFAESGTKEATAINDFGKLDYNYMDEIEDEKSISGEVISVQPFTPIGALSPGLNFRVKTKEGTLSVHLGYRHLDNMDFDIEVADNVEITGLRTTYQNEPVIIAHEVMIWRYLREPLWSS
jgi:hypothetical protein